jgi:signal transduction histidine kinase
MDAHYDPVRDGARLAALRAAAILDTPAEDRFDRLTRLAARFLDVPVALVSLVGDDRQFFKSCLGLPEPWASGRETPLSHSFCRYVVDATEPLVIEDAREHPLVRENPAIQDLGVIAYAGVPLTTGEGHVLGSLCAIDHKPRAWTDAEVQALSDLAGAVMTEIALEAKVQRRTLELREALDAAEASSRAKSQFMANLSHELRTPLTKLRGPLMLVEKLEGGQMSARGRQMLEISLRASVRLEAILLDLLLLSSIQVGDVTIEPSELRIEPLLSELASEFSHAAAEKGIALSVAAPAHLPPVVADGKRLKDALRRIVDNAIRFTDEGAVTLQAVPGEPVELRVTDTGMGIDPAAMERIFEAFEQSDNSETRRYQGFGIGLTIARGLCGLQGHTLAVDSRPGQGSTFRVVLG